MATDDTLPPELEGVSLHALLDAAPDAMILVDASGRIVLANAQSERLFGYTRGELLQSNVDRLVPDAVRAGHAAHRARFMADAKARPMGAALDLRARRKDGSEIPVEISLSPLETRGARLVTAAIRDISDRRRLEKERQEGRDRQRELEHLRQVDQFKTTFLNTAAHELRTPLLPVKAELFMLKRRLASSADPAVSGSLDLLERNIRRLAGLVEDLLDAARYQAGRITLKVDDADAHALVRDVVASFQQAAADHRLALSVETAGDPIVAMDAGRVSQVLYNLVGNAIKFTPDGGRIDVHSETGAGGLQVRVRDTGFGLTPDETKRLFEPFVQLRQAVEPGQRGSGLGLYISRGFIEAHGGRIWVESPGPDRGSTFGFTIPRRPAPHPARPGAP